MVPDVALADEHTGVVDRLGQTQLEDLGLQAPLQEVLDFEAQDVIQLHLALIQHTNADKSSQESVAWEKGCSTSQGKHLGFEWFPHAPRTN